jgi:hypothetical protein|tara:strand:- start:341 stop:871 length:531 start_codon:yes stop_codon:yes gene_type:complete
MQKQTKGDGILSLAKSLDKGIIPDKKVMEAIIDKIDNKLLDLRDEGLGDSPNSEDLQMVLEDLEELKKSNSYPAKIDYFSNFSKDLYDIEVENFIDDIKFSDDVLNDYDIDIMDYVEDYISLDNLNDMRIDDIYDRIDWNIVSNDLYIRFVEGNYESDDKEKLIEILLTQLKFRGE